MRFCCTIVRFFLDIMNAILYTISNETIYFLLAGTANEHCP